MNAIADDRAAAKKCQNDYDCPMDFGRVSRVSMLVAPLGASLIPSALLFLISHCTMLFPTTRVISRAIVLKNRAAAACYRPRARGILFSPISGRGLHQSSAAPPGTPKKRVLTYSDNA